MIVHKIVDYHAEHLFLIIREKVKAAIEGASATGLLQKNESIRLELSAAMSKAIGEMMIYQQADSAIHWATRRMLKSESFVEKIYQRIVEDHNVVSSFINHAERHVDKAMDEWRVTARQAKTVAILSDRAKYVTKTSKEGSCAHTEMSGSSGLRSQSRYRDSRLREHSCPHSPYAPDGNSTSTPTTRRNCLLRYSVKKGIRDVPKPLAFTARVQLNEPYVD